MIMFEELPFIYATWLMQLKRRRNATIYSINLKESIKLNEQNGPAYILLWF